MEVKKNIPISEILSENDISLNTHGVNSKIKANILDELAMRKIGFTNYCKDRWYFCRVINFPKTREYGGFEVSFSVTIPKDGSDIRIDVLDEAFCQPYDYQAMITNSRDKGVNPNKTCMIVFEQVEMWMQYLKDNGVLEGHEYGEYI